MEFFSWLCVGFGKLFWLCGNGVVNFFQVWMYEYFGVGSLGSMSWGLKCLPPFVGVLPFSWGLKCLPPFVDIWLFSGSGTSFHMSCPVVVVNVLSISSSHFIVDQIRWIFLIFFLSHQAINPWSFPKIMIGQGIISDARPCRQHNHLMVY